MIRSAFRLYCFGDFVFVTCNSGNCYKGVGFGKTIDEALCNMYFMEVRNA